MDDFDLLKKSEYYQEEILPFHPSIDGDMEKMRFYKHFSHEDLQNILYECWSRYLFRYRYPNVSLEHDALPSILINLGQSILDGKYHAPKIDLLGSYPSPSLSQYITQSPEDPNMAPIKQTPELICEIKMNTSERGLMRAFHQALFYAYKRKKRGVQVLVIADWVSEYGAPSNVIYRRQMTTTRYSTENYWVDHDGDLIRDKLRGAYITITQIRDQIIQLLLHAAEAWEKNPAVSLSEFLDRQEGILDYIFEAAPFYRLSDKHHSYYDSMDTDGISRVYFEDVSDQFRHEMRLKDDKHKKRLQGGR